MGILNTLLFSEDMGVFWSFAEDTPNWYINFGNTVYSLTGDGIMSILNDETNRRDALVQTIINSDIQVTKTFDNIEFVGEFNEAESFNNVKFSTATMDSKDLTGDMIDKREDTYKAVIPRDRASVKFGSRMRGKYMISEYKYISNGSSRMNLPYIKTKYRNSLI